MAQHPLTPLRGLTDRRRPPNRTGDGRDSRQWGGGRRTREQGISLVELLIGVVISIVVLGGAVQVLVSLIRGDTATQVELNRKDAVARVLGLMQDETRDARRVETGAGLLALSGCSATPQLILRGAVADEDISYALVSEATGDAWRGPARLVRCGRPYGDDGRLVTAATRVEQVVVDSLAASGFTATTRDESSPNPIAAGTIFRNVELSLTSNGSGSPSEVQVPIGINQIYGLASSGVTGTCPGGSGSVTTGCPDPTGRSIHYRPTLGGLPITGSSSLEDVFYFDGRRGDYTLRATSDGGGTGTCTRTSCTVILGGASITFSNGDVLVFRDIQIRL